MERNRRDSGAAGSGPLPCIGAIVTIVNAVAGNVGAGAKSAAAVGRPAK